MLKKLLIACVVFCTGVAEPRAQAKDYRIHGEIYTVMNTTVSGYIYWGRNLYWTDIFSASKPENPYTRYVNEVVPVAHQFACRFGNIKRIRVIGDNRIELEIRDGHIIELEDWLPSGNRGSLRIEADKETAIAWDLISEIVFSAAPDTAREPADTPITGTVETPHGRYTGIVQWDRDENSLSHVLDGRSGTSGITIAFKNIRSIASSGNSCQVVLNSGREFVLWGENDVDERNRGIVVNMPSVGQVVVGWADFKTFKSIPLNQVNLLKYSDFMSPRRIRGTVELKRGEVLEGVLVYDLDEAMDFELLDGRNGNVAYRIPFRNIRVIEPKNHKYTWLQLGNGGELVLGEERDVTFDNDGILVFDAKGAARYVRWRDVKRVSLPAKEEGNE